MVNLDKELARFDSIFRNILDEKEVICRSMGFMQDKRRERGFEKNYPLSRTGAGEDNGDFLYGVQ